MQNDAFANALAQFEIAEDLLGLEENIAVQLKSPQKLLRVSVPVKMDDGRLRVFTGYRSQFNDARGPFKGGIRFHPEVNESEVMALSAWMTWKTAVVGLPLGGGKGGVIVNPAELSEGELKRLSRGYIDAIYKLIGPEVDVPAPDVYTNPKIMGWMLDEYEKLVGRQQKGVITGKPLSIGGSQARSYSTAQGAVYVLDEAVNRIGLKRGASVAIQGFGNAGAFMAELLAKEGYKIIALSDSKGAIMDVGGLDVAQVAEHKKRSGSVAGFPGSRAIEDILSLETDILVPAALENSINEANAGLIRAKLIIELANGPVTPEADKILEEKNILVVPDILANAGGVAVSYFEQVQNSYNYYWSEAEVLAKLEETMKRSFEEAWAEKEKHKTSMRMGAYVLAVGRVAQAMRDRGRI